MKHDENRTRHGGLGSLVGLTALALLNACSSPALDPASERTIEGTLETVVVGNSALERSHFEYFLETRDGAWIKLSFESRPELLHGDDDHRHLVLPGHAHDAATGRVELRATGLLDANGLTVSDIEFTGRDTEIDHSAEPLIAASPRKVAVILANFSNNSSQPITPSAARDLVFAGAQSANAYFKEVSFGIRSLVGKVAATGDVYGWYTIAASNTTCDYSAWGSAARAAAQAAGVDLSGYDHIIHYFPQSSACQWSGVGQVPGKYTWINSSGSQTIAHELGHNFGSHHAASLRCTGANGAAVPISANCTTSEYGNPFDVMGRGYRHLTAFNKGRVGFLEPENTVTASADGTFDIAPLEKKSTIIQSLRVRIDASTAYYVEFRQPYGFDNFTATSSVVKGVLITRAPMAYTTLAMPGLIDMTPSTSSYTDAALLPGQTFTDPARNLSIRLNSVSATSANVTVDFP
jgi:hypothetical protein